MSALEKRLARDLQEATKFWQPTDAALKGLYAADRKQLRRLVLLLRNGWKDEARRLAESLDILLITRVVPRETRDYLHITCTP